MVKKSVYVLLFIICCLTGTVFADSRYHTVTQNIVIQTDAGNTQYALEEGTITLRDKSDGSVAYVDQFSINSDGGFSYKFKFTGNIDEYDLYLRDAYGNPIRQDITAVSENTVLTVNLEIDLDNDGLFISDDEQAYLNAAITNTFGDERPYTLILAMYDENGRLINCDSSEKRNVNYSPDIYTDVFKAKVPKNTASVKAYAFSSMEEIIPLSSFAERKLSNYIELPNIISDNMLVQAEQPINIWGRSSYIGEEITAAIYGENDEVITEGTSIVNNDGTFSFAIPAASASRNCTLKVYTNDEEVVVSNVLIGELWLMGGQSNMGLRVNTLSESVKNQIIPESEINDIRWFYSQNQQDTGKPIYDNSGSWVVANSETVKEFSAVGFVAAKEIYDKLGVPVGGIDTSLGGTSMAQWVSDNNALGLKSGTYYNTRVAAFSKMNIKGVLWYQGESGEDRAGLTVDDYTPFTHKFENLITSWRNVWNKADLPFVFAQLPIYNTDFSKVRLAQLDSYKTIDNTAMAVTVDCLPNKTLYPTEEAIHYHNKIPVGLRLAHSALKHFYNYEISDGSGPMFESLEISGNEAILTFNNTGEGLTTTDGQPPRYFAIAGADGVYYHADAEIISKNQILLTSENVQTPKYVRYLLEFDDNYYSGDDNYPVVNLYNSNGVPCSSFIAN